ncbi:MAG: hypothetical protein R2851_22055 [Caldilineaceae bacterium]
MDPATLAEVRRVLTPSGRLLIVGRGLRRKTGCVTCRWSTVAPTRRRWRLVRTFCRGRFAAYVADGDVAGALAWPLPDPEI